MTGKEGGGYDPSGRSQGTITGTQQVQVDAALALVGCLVPVMRGRGGYVSMPLGSGARLYDWLEREKVQSVDDLPKEKQAGFKQRLMAANAAAGRQIAMRLSHETGRCLLCPGSFQQMEDWGELAYKLLWETLFEDPGFSVMYMVNGWEYSSGCSYEFLHGMTLRYGARGKVAKHIDVLNEQQRRITLNRGAELLSQAVIDLESRGFSSGRLVASLDDLVQIAREVTSPLGRIDELPKDAAEIDLTSILRVQESVKK